MAMALGFSVLALICVIGFVVFIILAFTKIAQKAGYHPAMGLLALIPYLNFIFILIFEFSKWPIYEYVDEEKVKPQKPLSMPILVLIIIVDFLPFLALLSAIVIPNFMRARISANDALAMSSLRALSVATENYAADNNGRYPLGTSELVNGKFPYLQQDYCGETISGFVYECENSSFGYKYIAVPEGKGASGSKTLSIVTGGFISEEEIGDDEF